MNFNTLFVSSFIGLVRDFEQTNLKILQTHEKSIDKIYKLLERISQPQRSSPQRTNSTTHQRSFPDIITGNQRRFPDEMTGVFTNRIFTAPTTTFQFNESIPLYPTPSEINRTCTTFIYSDLSTNFIICPITRQNFQSNDEILRINYCEHIFKKHSLMQWFNNHATCPVCRYNILTGQTPSLFSQ